MLVFGGRGERYYNDVWRYHIAGGWWELLFPNTERTDENVRLCDSFTGALRSNHEKDGQIPQPRNGHTAHILPGDGECLRRCVFRHLQLTVGTSEAMLVFGGGSPKSTFSNDCYLFDIQEQCWRVISVGDKERPSGRCYHGSVLIAAQGIVELIVFGGMSAMNDTVLQAL